MTLQHLQFDEDKLEENWLQNLVCLLQLLLFLLRISLYYISFADRSLRCAVVFSCLCGRVGACLCEWISTPFQYLSLCTRPASLHAFSVCPSLYLSPPLCRLSLLWLRSRACGG